MIDFLVQSSMKCSLLFSFNKDEVFLMFLRRFFFFIENECIRFTDNDKFLGVHFDESLTLEHHISQVSSN